MRLLMGGGGSRCCVSPKLSRKAGVDSSNLSMVLCFWRPKSETGFREALPRCPVKGGGSGRVRCSVKALEWVCEGGEGCRAEEG